VPLQRNFFFGLSGGDNVAKAVSKFVKFESLVSKNGLCSSFAAYSSTFNRSITNSERGIFLKTAHSKTLLLLEKK
jgi:NAD+--asparagine ADP-ribosyltransferase